MSTRSHRVAIILGIGLAGAMGCGKSANILTANRLDGGDTELNTNAEVGTDSDSGSADDEECPPDEVAPGEVALIGDAWIRIPASRISEKARAAGTIGQDDAFVNLAADGVPIASIVDQYNTRQSRSPVRVLIMNGGGIDLIGGGGSQATVDQVVATLTQHLEQVASDGTVRHVIYSLCPEISSTPGVADLRPGMEASCSASAVPCYFLDLQPLWEGHPEYNGIEDIIPTDTGADVIAEAIWTIMEENCIAQ
jgi:hypothetical protein